MEKNSRRRIGRGSCPSSREKRKVSRSTNGSSKAALGTETAVTMWGRGNDSVVLKGW